YVEAFYRTIDSYNQCIESNNSIISAFKSGLGSSDLKIEEKSLDILNQTKISFEDKNKKLCDEYIELSKSKKGLEAEKVLARDKLEKETQRIPGLYQEKINEYLERFG